MNINLCGVCNITRILKYLYYVQFSLKLCTPLSNFYRRVRLMKHLTIVKTIVKVMKIPINIMSIYIYYIYHKLTRYFQCYHCYDTPENIDTQILIYKNKNKKRANSPRAGIQLPGFSFLYSNETQFYIHSKDQKSIISFDSG